MNEKYLLLKGCAGLGNRIFSILNALEYCKSNNRKLVVDWSDGQFGRKGINVFPNYFRINDECYYDGPIEKIYEIQDCNPMSWKNKLSLSIYDLYEDGRPSFLVKQLPSVFFNNNFKNRLNNLWIKKHKKNQKNKYNIKDILDRDNMTFGHLLSNNLNNELIIYADFIPHVKKIGLIDKLQLNISLVNEINDWSNKYALSKNYIGLHIRYSDKKPNKRIDVLISFIQNNYGDHPIYLATDNKEIENVFRKEFSNLISYPKNIPDEVAGRGIHMWGIDNSDEKYKTNMLEESIVDMWMLSKCKILFYQGNSSFSRISRLLHSDNKKCYDWEKK